MLNNFFKPILERLPTSNRLELVWKLALIDFKRRYYNSYLGVIWALLNPLSRAALYYIVFTLIFEPKIDNYGTYIVLGLIFWLFFKQGVNKSFQIIKRRKYLIDSMQFNKIDLFYSSVLSDLIGFLFSLVAYFMLSIYSGIPFSIHYLWLPLFIFNVSLFILGLGMIFSVIYIFLDDIIHIWDMISFAGFWLTPILYAKAVIFEKLPFLLYLNPVAGLVINIREAIFYNRTPDIFFVFYNLIYAGLFFLIGHYLINKYGHYATEKL